MGTVTDIKGELEDRESVRRFARLAGIVEKQNAEILADPIPFLIEAGDRLARQAVAIERAMHELDGIVDAAFPKADEPIRRPDMLSELYERNRRARDILAALIKAP